MTQGQPNTHTHTHTHTQHTHTHTHTHTHSLTDGSRAFCVAALFINLSGDVTSSNHLLFGGICPKTTSLSGATDSQYHTHKHTVPLGPPGIGFYPESHFLCLDMISVGNRKPSTFFSHDSRVACGLGAEAWLLSSWLLACKSNYSKNICPNKLLLQFCDSLLWFIVQIHNFCHHLLTHHLMSLFLHPHVTWISFWIFTPNTFISFLFQEERKNIFRMTKQTSLLANFLQINLNKISESFESKLEVHQFWYSLLFIPS